MKVVRHINNGGKCRRWQTKPYAYRLYQFGLFFAVMLMLAGCSTITGKPRMRFGAYFGSPIGMTFADPNNLGNHNYYLALGEKDGMVYTCKAGFIDIGHIREAADRTRYFTLKTQQHLMGDNKKFCFQVIEPTQYWVTLSYPQSWEQLNRRQKAIVADEVASIIGPYVAHVTLVWHEIITWYGYASAKIFSDRISAFSCEDIYSDTVGIHLATEAMKYDHFKYDQMMTQLLYQKLQELDVRSVKVARQAAKSVKGKWYTGGFYFFVKMKKHNFDIGLDDGTITPLMVSGICDDNSVVRCPVPDLKPLERFGFQMNIQIDMRVFEAKQIRNAIALTDDTRIDPSVHYRLLLMQIEKEYEQQNAEPERNVTFHH